MKTTRLLPLVALASTAAAFAGCTQAYDTDNVGMDVRVEPAHNILGIVKTSPGSYASVSPATFRLSTDEISARRDFSGDNVSLFWGLITITDY